MPSSKIISQSPLSKEEKRFDRVARRWLGVWISRTPPGSLVNSLRALLIGCKCEGEVESLLLQLRKPWYVTTPTWTWALIIYATFLTLGSIVYLLT